MASRFRGRTSDAECSPSGLRGDLFGESWVTLGALAFGLLALTAAVSRFGPADLERAVREAGAPEVATSERSSDVVEKVYAAICAEPALVVLELERDCATGVVTLPDAYFTPGSHPRIRHEAREYLVSAVTTYLGRLRESPELWERLEAIELRGHADPFAARGQYATNLIVSQRRAEAVVLFLLGPGGIPAEADRRDLERLAVVSGSSFSRPPAACPESTAACLPYWRRVEIRPVLAPSPRAG